MTTLGTKDMSSPLNLSSECNLPKVPSGRLDFKVKLHTLGSLAKEKSSEWKLYLHTRERQPCDDVRMYSNHGVPK